MKEVPFPVAQARRQNRKRPTSKKAPSWRRPDPFHISVEERRRPVLRGRPVLFWNGGSPL